MKKGMIPIFTPVKLCVNHSSLDTARDRCLVTEGPETVLSWAAVSDLEDSRQSAYQAVLKKGESVLYDSGWTETDEQSVSIGVPLPKGEEIEWTLRIRDNHGNTSEEARAAFFIGDIRWTADWIAPGWTDPLRPAYFRKRFYLKKQPVRAALYICGLGYFSVSVNGIPLPDNRLDPAHTDYTKSCQYAVYPRFGGLKPGENELNVVVAAGWRFVSGRYIKEDPVFFGPLQLSAMLLVEYEDGTKEQILTGPDWECGQGPTLSAHLFDGETFDARIENIEYGRVNLVKAPGGAMKLMTIPPVREEAEIRPVSVSRLGEGWILDFGKNIAGVARLRFPCCPEEGQKITLRYFERLRGDGTPYFDNLRGAKATDIYTASGREGKNGVPDHWQPRFTYHGFRYILLGDADPYHCEVSAVPLHTDLKSTGMFRCGSAVINAIQDMVVRTEKDNMHSILTDCPQRDERMGWMNDATVRFEETPYNFDAAVMFKKICRDISDGQKPDGAISCTAPKVYGAWPADPVCSSFLVAGRMAWLHGGDKSVIREQFSNYARWEQCLLDHSDGYIVNYSYYGDWAGPAYACVSGENAKSAVTPGEFMSTGYSYYNCMLLSGFAHLLGRREDEENYNRLAEKIAEAMKQKWYRPETKTFATGSMACQAFALWLDLIPESDRADAARALKDDVVNSGYRFTTGNLCTKYLLDVLSRFGYVDEAYELVTREEYPSWGFMLQNEATTVWERFELKDNGGMNSYCHPMYGALGAWFYSALAGLTPLENGWKRFKVCPRLPKKLLSCQASLDTPRGYVNLRWVQQEGKKYLQIDVPFGAEAEVEFGNVKRTCASGHHSFCEEGGNE